jgi:hypothetical protein
MARVGVVLVGHGQLPSCIPKELGSEYLKLKFKENRTRMEEERFEELENVVLNWARNEVNDPYAHSLQTLASELSMIGGMRRLLWHSISSVGRRWRRLWWRCVTAMWMLLSW